MNEYLYNIINNPNSTSTQISVAKKWLELNENIGTPVCNKNIPQILSCDWEQEALRYSQR